MDKKIEQNTKKISSKDFKFYVFEDNSWTLHSKKIPVQIKKLIQIYQNSNSIKNLIDEDNNSKFLKGSLNENNLPSGKRIKILPNGKQLARGGFSLFAKNLKLNDDENSLWDIVYENSSGSKTYLYNEDKVELEHEKKAKIVDEFSKVYNKILVELEKDIKTKDDTIYLALLIMIKTFIRVGNLEYYNHLGHKGLTTLQKKDIKINVKENLVSFNFIGKDGVPQNIEKKFEIFYIKKLIKLLKNTKKMEFVFVDKNKKPLHSSEFSKILFEYTNQHFYPHIIRSFHADKLCENFLKNNKISTKKNVEEKFLEIAKDLGHKKFNKKKEKWETSFKVTINNYIRPKYSKKMIEMYKK